MLGILGLGILAAETMALMRKKYALHVLGVSFILALCFHIFK